MFFIEPQRTPFDLNFRLFGTDIRVHPLFWIFSAALGWNMDWRITVLWVGCVFVSILIHELGHVFAFRLFGVHSLVVLYGLGGLAIPSGEPRSRWQRIFVSFAGPLAQFILFTIFVALGLYFGVRLYLGAGMFLLVHPGEMRSMLVVALNYMLFINLFWPILNLFPVWPLDGGRISRELCTWVAPRNGARISLVISIITAGVLALLAVTLWQDVYLAVFFGLMALSSFQALQVHQDPPWKRWDERGR